MATIRSRGRCRVCAQLIDTPGWSWLYQDDDAMAAMYVTALHHLMQCWGSIRCSPGWRHRSRSAIGSSAA